MKLSADTGVLLVNLGTPDDPSESSVRRYLKEFLSDPYVIDIPAPLRWMLLNLIILPRRPAKSAEAYRKVWTERGSPLLFHSEDLAQKVQTLLPKNPVVLAMRYGSPSIAEGLKKLRSQGVKRVMALPLYPQYSLAATESSVQKIKSTLQEMSWSPDLEIRQDFFAHPMFIGAFAELTRPFLEKNPDHILFSFHGIPERHVKKTDPTGAHCLATPGCCDRITEANSRCYRAQCFETARQLARELNLKRDSWSVSFQSRLGRTPWIQPFTDVVFSELAAQGKKKLLVVCPAFTADCLETLEEIEIRGRNDFKNLGGDDLWMVPSLNSSKPWVDAVVDMVRGA